MIKRAITGVPIVAAAITIKNERMNAVRGQYRIRQAPSVSSEMREYQSSLVK
jgi:hypothetical protein